MLELRAIMKTAVDGGVRPSARMGMRTGLVLACLAACGLGASARAQDGGGEVAIPDQGLRCAVTEALGKAPGEPVTRDELATLETLSSSCEPPVADLTGLEHATGLRNLELVGNAITDLAPLSELAALGLLDLADNAISEIAPLSGLTALNTLDLSANRIADIAPLAALTSLSWLRVDSNAVSDIGPLSGLTALGELNLANNRIMDIAPLATLTGLRWLGVDNNAISDVGPLSGLTALGVLYLGNNQITDVTPLAALTGLDWLGLGTNAISDIGPLADLTGLSWLHLGANAIADIGPLGDLAGLSSLHLGENAITDIEPLSALAGLGWLDLAENAITDIGPLRSLTGLTWLDLADNAIEDIGPLSFLAALRDLNLGRNSVADIEPLSGLDALEGLTLSGNPISQIAPLSGLAALAGLDFENASVVDVEPLSGLTALNVLYLGGNLIADLEPLSGLTDLYWLRLGDNSIKYAEPLSGLIGLGGLGLGGNAIVDIGFLEGLTGLRWLDAHGNAIEDLEPLSGLADLRMADVRNNPLNAASISGQVQGLREAGATVRWNWERDGREVVWLVPSARDPVRQGFVRLINNSDQAGEVSIVAIDDLGRRHDPITLAIGANEAAHFNSNDLESGNPAKGLSDGTGPGDGDWRLEIDSDLELTALGYMRTADGFLTSLHDVVPVVGNGYRIVTFNPASNWRQVSSLRLVNPGTEDAAVTIRGVDDGGASPGSAVQVDVPAGAAATLAASDLESGAGLDGALGDGSGKWRLMLQPTQPIVAMSLLSSPTGHLTNLSTALASSAGAYRVPLFPSASDALGRQGFMRVRNGSNRAGLVRIEAHDDSETLRKAVVHLRIGAGETRHLNSQDLELGNAAKGLVGSTGTTQGNWVLEVSSRQYVEVLSYIRTADGFVTAMHDVAPRRRGAAHMAIFNPGSNFNQVSRLRLYNPRATAAAVRITATDDSGAPGSAVTLWVPGRAARTISAAELESGGAGLTGALGDGQGKWRLRVESDADISAMHLMSSPTGHLTNLSTAPD